MLSRIHHWSRHLLAHLPAAIPSSCALCGLSDREVICASCHQQFFKQRAPRCAQCAIPLMETSTVLCGECLKQPPAFDATIVAADYAPPVDQLVLALKFGGRLALAPLFARLLRDALLQTRIPGASLPTLMTAVPLGSHRLAERGFNQALEIAKPLARAQALLHPDERHKNIRNVFAVSPQAIDSINGRHIGVVDDVITTGETLNELAATLKRFGASRVTNFVFARTLPKS